MQNIIKIGLAAMLLGFNFSMPMASLLYSRGRRRLVIQGSTTVFPISVATAEAYMEKNPGSRISVRGGGSGGGIRALVEGGKIIAQSSRPMRHKEKMRMVSAGRESVEHIIAYDGMAIIVHPDNPVSNLTVEKVAEIFAGNITCWSEVDGNRGKIVLISRDVGSGTYFSFIDLVMKGKKICPRALFQASSGAIASAVAGSPGAIGYVGIGFISDRVKALKINNVKPTLETVIEGDYPLVRPLYFYTDGEPEGLAKSYLAFVMSEEGQKIVMEEGFVPVIEID